MSRKKQDRALAGTAWHEAGHAVGAVRLKIPFKYVTIEPEGDALGYIRYSGRRPRSREQLEHRAVNAYTGELAQAKQFNEMPNSRTHGSQSDHDTAIDQVSRLSGAEGAVLEAYLNWLYERAKALVNQDFNWRCIQAVARALIVKRRLSRAEVNKLITTALRDGMAKSRKSQT